MSQEKIAASAERFDHEAFCSLWTERLAELERRDKEIA
jgi:hypothetical protein